jgi:hypothetical protein
MKRPNADCVSLALFVDCASASERKLRGLFGRKRVSPIGMWMQRIACPQLGRAVLQQDQTVSSGRNPSSPTTWLASIRIWLRANESRA